MNTEGIGRNCQLSGLTRHAHNRMDERGISVVAIDMAMAYGRISHIRGAEIFTIGHKEILQFREEGIDLKDFSGVHVVCKSRSNSIMTTYRNNNLKGLRH